MKKPPVAERHFFRDMGVPTNVYLSCISERFLPRLVSVLELDSESKTIREVFDALTGPSFAASSSGAEGYCNSLSGSTSPLEFCLIMAREGCTGLQYSFEPVSNEVDGSRRIAYSMNRISAFINYLNWGAALPMLDRVYEAFVMNNSYRLKALYCSVAHVLKNPIRVKVYFAADNTGFSPDDLFRICAALGYSNPQKEVMWLLEAVACNGVHMIGLNFQENTVRSVKFYVFKPYMHLALINRLASAGNLPLRCYYLLLRWYQTFVNRASGRLGWYGIGVNSGQLEQPRVELYVYSDESRALEFHCALEKWIRRQLSERGWKVIKDVLSEDIHYGSYSPLTAGPVGLGFELAARDCPGHMGIYISPVMFKDAKLRDNEMGV